MVVEERDRNNNKQKLIKIKNLKIVCRILQRYYKRYTWVYDIKRAVVSSH